MLHVLADPAAATRLEALNRSARSLTSLYRAGVPRRRIYEEIVRTKRDPALLVGLTRGLEEWIPELRLEVLPGARHWVPYERPEEVNRLIREFVDG